MTEDGKNAPNEAEVERVHRMFLQFVGTARQLSPINAEALINRLRVDVMTNDFGRERKNLYQATADYFEDILDERLSKMPESRADTKNAIRSYVARFFESNDH